MDIARTYENIFDESEYGTKSKHMPKILEMLQNRLWALKISGCKLVSFKSFVKFFGKRIATKKSAKKQGYRQMFTEEEIR